MEILKYLLEYFVLGYILTTIRISYWQYLLKQKPSLTSFEDLNLVNKILCYLIYPIQTHECNKKLFCLIPFNLSSYNFDDSDKSFLNQTIINNTNSLISIGLGDNKELITTKEFIIRQIWFGIPWSPFYVGPSLLLASLIGIHKVLSILVATLFKFLKFIKKEFNNAIYSDFNID